MDEKTLDFDQKKHLLYSQEVKEVIQKKLGERHAPGVVEQLWEKVQLQYAAFLRNTPDLGGKKCIHNGGAGGTYDCIALFAYYEAMDEGEKPSVEELFEMNNALLLPPYERMGKLVDINKGFLRRLMNLVFVITGKKDNKLAKEIETGYIVKVEPYEKEIGIRYRYEQCPIAEFARANGYLDLMPAFCNGDYPALERIHARLIREKTCANSTICDYWIVGDRSRHVAEHPRKTDEKGFWYNE